MNSLSPRARIAVAWLPAILYTLLIWWLSSQPLNWPIIERMLLRDKGVHFLEYGALSLFITHAIATTWRELGVRAVLAATIITAALGLVDELHQAFVPGRSSDALDLLADTIGALFFSALYIVLLRLWQRRRPQHGLRRVEAISEPPLE